MHKRQYWGFMFLFQSERCIIYHHHMYAGGPPPPIFSVVMKSNSMLCSVDLITNLSLDSNVRSEQEQVVLGGDRCVSIKRIQKILLYIVQRKSRKNI